jgi:hypothetical protein
MMHHTALFEQQTAEQAEARRKRGNKYVIIFIVGKGEIGAERRLNYLNTENV